MNFFKISIRFSGFLAVILTSQWLLASRNQWGLRKVKNSLQKFIKSQKILENSEKFSILLRCENPIKYASSAVVFGSELQKPWFSCFLFSPKSLKNYGFPCFWRKFTKKLWFSMVSSKYTQKLWFSMLLEKMH